MRVFPRLGAYERPEQKDYRQVASGVPGLDRLIGGGLEEGSTCLVVGPSGTGKSTVATAYAVAAANGGGRAAIFLFDERPETYLKRADGLGIPLRPLVEAGRVHLQQIDPAEIAPGEFAQLVRALVEEDGIKAVVIDSAIGYFNAMGAPDILVTQLHELLTFLARSGVLTILCGAQEGFMSIGIQQGPDVSYLSDAIFVLGYFEADGDIHRCVTAVKKKLGPHETTIHELLLEPGSVRVGEEPLRQYRDLLVPNANPNGDAPRIPAGKQARD